METIQMLGSLGEFVGAIAVVATLVYLAIQVRHSKEAMSENSTLVRQAGLDQTNEQFSRHRDRIINDAEVAKIWIDEAKVTGQKLAAVAPMASAVK